MMDYSADLTRRTLVKAIRPPMEKRSHFMRTPPGVTMADRGGSHRIAAKARVIVPASSGSRHNEVKLFYSVE